MPYHVAMELLLTGRWMGASEAARWGLVNEVLDGDEAVRARAWETARLLASGPPLVFAAIKETARVAESLRFQEAMDLVTTSQLPTVAKLYTSEDHDEGFQAFAEKRKPVWKGR
jgi:crotonobetainyl-CoA hydratase